MKADEVELAVGQQWRARDGTVAEVVDFDQEDGYTPWQAEYQDGQRRWLTDRGRYQADGTQSKYDLLELLRSSLLDPAAFVPASIPELPINLYEPVEVKKSAYDTQVGGDHYKGMAIQPMQFSMANGLDACTHSVIKYLTRKKGDKAKRAEDLRKAIHCIQLLAQHEGIELGETAQPAAAPYSGPDRHKGASHG